MSKQHERLILTTGQSEHLRRSGIRFAVICPASYPDAGQFALHLIPCTYQETLDAVAVAMGEKRTVAISKKR